MLKPESKQAVSNFFAAAETEFNAFLKARSPGGVRGRRPADPGFPGQGRPSPRHRHRQVQPCVHLRRLPVLLHRQPRLLPPRHRGRPRLLRALAAGDVVIAISNSGETAELKATVLAVQNNGCKVIGVSGNPNSWLAKHTDAFLFAGVKAEGGPLNRAPRNSVLAELLTLQALSVALQVEKDWDPVKYVRCHPGGKLGELRENEK